MDKSKIATLSTIAGVLATLFASLATNGEKTLAVLGGVPKLLAAWSSGLPLGTGSWLAAVAVGTGLWLYLLPRLPRAPDGSRAHLKADNYAISAVIVLVLAQRLLAGITVGTGQLLMAFAVGIIGGFMAPWLGRVLRSVWIHRTKQEGQCPPAS